MWNACIPPRLHPRILACLLVLAAAVAPQPAFAASVPRAATSPGTDLADDIRVQIAAQARGQLKSFYAARDFAPLWAASGAIGPEANALFADLASADLDGLKPSSYKLAQLEAALADAATGDPRAIARAELKLSDALARYVRDLRKPSKVGMTWLDPQLKPRKLDAGTVLRTAALTNAFPAYVTAMGWMSPHYVRLRALTARAEALDLPPEDRRRLRLNLDRARILPGPWVHHIVVDAASGRLWFYQAGKQAGTMRVVVGKPETPTPMLAGMLQYAILNPYWNIPVDLAQTLVAPKVLAGRSLKSMGYEALSDWTATPQRLDASLIDWPSVASGATEIRIRQLPGPANSMGRVKFMFPNDDGIYLHDTPDRALFKARDRHFSNGCIRLEDAPTLGKWLLGRPIRTSARTPEQAVALPVPVPVFLTYLTADDTAKGIEFRPDIYDRDRL